MDDFLARSQLLLGDNAIDALKNSQVTVCGLGGVGSYVVEALARSGIGSLRLIDFDVVDISNINRQLCALRSTIGKIKAEVLSTRIKDINPDCKVDIIKAYIDTDNVAEVLPKCDYIVDAIDYIPGKIAIIRYALSNSIPVISAMGAAKRLYPEKLRLADISATHCCPLARIIRKELKTIGIENGLRVVFSEEKPIALNNNSSTRDGIKQPLGSVSFVPGAMGLIIAGEIVRHICGIEV